MFVCFNLLVLCVAICLHFKTSRGESTTDTVAYFFVMEWVLVVIFGPLLALSMFVNFLTIPLIGLITSESSSQEDRSEDSTVGLAPFIDLPET